MFRLGMHAMSSVQTAEQTPQQLKHHAQICGALVSSKTLHVLHVLLAPNVASPLPRLIESKDDSAHTDDFLDQHPVLPPEVGSVARNGGLHQGSIPQVARCVGSLGGAFGLVRLAMAVTRTIATVYELVSGGAYGE